MILLLVRTSGRFILSPGCTSVIDFLTLKLHSFVPFVLDVVRQTLSLLKFIWRCPQCFWMKYWVPPLVWQTSNILELRWCSQNINLLKQTALAPRCILRAAVGGALSLLVRKNGLPIEVLWLFYPLGGVATLSIHWWSKMFCQMSLDSEVYHRWNQRRVCFDKIVSWDNSIDLMTKLVLVANLTICWLFDTVSVGELNILFATVLIMLKHSTFQMKNYYLNYLPMWRFVELDGSSISHFNSIYL